MERQLTKEQIKKLFDEKDKFMVNIENLFKYIDIKKVTITTIDNKDYTFWKSRNGQAYLETTSILRFQRTSGETDKTI